MSVPGLSLLGLKRIRGFVSILRSINPTIIIINIHTVYIVRQCITVILCHNCRILNRLEVWLIENMELTIYFTVCQILLGIPFHNDPELFTLFCSQREFMNFSLEKKRYFITEF